MEENTNAVIQCCKVLFNSPIQGSGKISAGEEPNIL